MKQKLNVCLLGLIFLVFAGCGSSSNLTIGSVEQNNSRLMSMRYQLFNGSKETRFTVKEGKSLTVTVEISSESGTLDAYIAKDNDAANAVYQGTDLAISSFTVTVSESGTYTICVQAKNHKGSYSFSW